MQIQHFFYSQQFALCVPVGVVVREKTTLQHLVRAERQNMCSGILYTLQDSSQ
jgi:hypothetical protein